MNIRPPGGPRRVDPVSRRSRQHMRPEDSQSFREEFVRRVTEEEGEQEEASPHSRNREEEENEREETPGGKEVRGDTVEIPAVQERERQRTRNNADEAEDEDESHPHIDLRA